MYKLLCKGVGFLNVGTESSSKAAQALQSNEILPKNMDVLDMDVLRYAHVPEILTVHLRAK
jgi:hypothetical protein